MQPHQERVVTERDELNEKRIKLISFIETATFDGLNGAEKDRLRRQAAIMTEYYTVLGERINSFTDDSKFSDGTPGPTPPSELEKMKEQGVHSLSKDCWCNPTVE